MIGKKNLESITTIEKNQYRASFKTSNMELGFTPENVKKLMNATERDADEIYGFHFSWSETKAFCAVQKLLDTTDYEGHAQTRKMQTILGEFSLPIIYCDIPTYLKAYGLKKNDGNKFNRNQRDEAIKALEKLEEPRKICFERKWFKQGKGKEKGQWMSDFIVTDARLIKLIKHYTHPSNSENAQKVRSLQSSTQRTKYIEICCSPIFVDQINRQYIEKPRDLFEEIEKAVGNKNRKSSKTIYNLILLLLQSDLKEYKIKRKNLAYKLELEYLIKAYHQSKINNIINNAISIASKLGYLAETKYEEQKEIYYFYPNPEKCCRLKKKNEKKELLNHPLSNEKLIELDIIFDLDNF